MERGREVVVNNTRTGEIREKRDESSEYLTVRRNPSVTISSGIAKDDVELEFRTHESLMHPIIRIIPILIQTSIPNTQPPPPLLLTFIPFSPLCTNSFPPKESLLYVRIRRSSRTFLYILNFVLSIRFIILIY